MPGSMRPVEPAGTWELRVTLGTDPVTGRRRTTARRFRGTEAQARKALARFAVETEDRRPGSEGTFGHLVESWLALADRDLSPTTMRTYRGIVRRHLPVLLPVPLGRLDAGMLDRLYVQLAGQGLSPRTIQQVHAVIRRALSQAVRWGWVEVNVAKRATPPRVAKPQIDPPSVEDVQKLLRAADEWDPMFGCLVRLAAATGARRGELCGLRWSDVDLPRLAIRRAVIETDDGIEVGPTKTHERRVVTVDAATVLALKDQRSRAKVASIKAEVPLAPDAYLFSLALDGGTPLKPSYVSLAWSRLCKRQGIRCRFHDLRHFHATAMIQAGVPLPSVSARLGHRDTTTTVNLYAHAVEEADRAAADAIGEILP